MALKGPRTGSYTNAVNSRYNFNRLPVADFVTAQTPAGPDEYFKNTTLLLSTSVTNGAQNNTFLDSSNNNFTITRNGNATQGSFSPHSLTGWSNYFDGTGDDLTIPTNSAFTYGTGDFTIEMWVYITANPGSYAYIYGQGPNSSASMSLYIQGGVFSLWNGSAVISGSTSYSLNRWYHVAISRSGTSLRLFLNGVQEGSATNSSNITTGSSFGVSIGRWAEIGDPGYFTGYISNVRVLKGTALYTSTFTPPTSPLTAISNTSLLTCQSNRFIDNSTNNFTITRNGDVSIQPFAPFNPTEEYSTTTVGGSAYFDGTGDYIDVANVDTAFGASANFTVEFWMYPTIINSAVKAIIDPRTSDASAHPLLWINTSNQLYYFTTNANRIVGTTTLNANQWYHVALVRNSGTTTMYLNGVVEGTPWADTVNYASSTTFRIAQRYASTAFNYGGHICDLRVVKGTAIYTGNFTPPAAPILVSGSSTPYTNTSNVNTTFAAANTSLLCNFTNAGIFDATARNILETVGNAQASQTQTKFGASSMYFDGTGDYLQLPATPNLSFGTGDFTVEFWVRFDSIAADRGFLGSGAGGYDFVWRTSTGLNLGRINTAFDNTFAWSPSINVWYHVAYSRSGTSLKVFVDGAQVGTTATNSNSYDAVTAAIIGGSTTTDRLMNGYLDDFRITKGYARYTSNFTPPTRTFALR